MLLSPVKPMHIPDGFLSISVAILLWIISIGVIAIALRKVKYELGDRNIPLMGVLAAAIFAGQMLNFSVTGGTSGHLLGAAIAAILLGPWAAILVMTSVVSVQALLFQDGGILALGANIFNMAVVGVFVSYTVYSVLEKIFENKTWGILVSGFIAAWSSIFLAALACALQLSLSGTLPVNIAIPAMGIIHALIGIGEGLITIGALAFLLAARKDLLQARSKSTIGNNGILLGGGAIILLLLILSPLASSHPDGLEWVAKQQGFLGNTKGIFHTLMPDYLLPGISNPSLATIFAGILGALIVFGVASGIARTEKQSPINEEAGD
jgi:cobalt/nickel transport system permease protein